jgi:hypothetical protein
MNGPPADATSQVLTNALSVLLIKVSYELLILINLQNSMTFMLNFIQIKQLQTSH